GSRAFARAGRPRSDRGPRDDRTEQEETGGEGMGLAGALDAWDEHLALKGAELLAGRIELTDALRPLVAKAYAEVSGEVGEASITYRQSSAGQESSEPGGIGQESSASLGGETGPRVDRAVLADGLREALVRGVGLVGPHRDEWELRIGDLPARGYASHGESWSMALALRLAGYELLRA